ncbi:peptidoglycan DD-metalloendopeptidase family protein [Sediminispirochaeta smaragdinae]|uniref:Peptidase M23 n=1 Tax=Sediminispirochaeta smaragdinae (strain DSM 11293 / JCM 15392 / SEBR 4228) TaxID=573413 RepID=E1R4J5_SEDSS|nr:M23 family metallopeptidase [Sediminispirochaeta smaragdinae]ADK81736.1 Peptidase M23 [Sediminispirochaeta smaragdinae DSM 11293]
MDMEVLHQKQQVRKRRSFFSRLRTSWALGHEREDDPVLFPEMKQQPRRHSAPSKREKIVILSLGSIILAGGCVGLAFFVGSGPRALPDLGLTPGASTVHKSLFSYVNSDTANQGSGSPILPDGVLFTSVSSRAYTLERGDTLSEIAHENGLDVGTLIAFNNITDVRKIYAGSELKIPNVDGIPYTVRSGDSVASIAEKFSVPVNYILDANDLQSEVITAGQILFVPGGQISEYDYKKAMGTLFIYPTRGRLTSPFGYRSDPFTGVRSMHYGIDLAGPVGTPVSATMEGTVVLVGDRPRGFGKYVVIRHSHGFQSLYGHLSRILVRKGQHISQGQQIGEMGSTGRSTGPHLHFALYRNNVPVNPLGGYLYK